MLARDKHTSLFEPIVNYRCKKLLDIGSSCKTSKTEAKLVYGGVSKNHLKVIITSRGEEKVDIGLIVFTDREHPKINGNEPTWYKWYKYFF
jgi:hypothetical protein